MTDAHERLRRLLLLVPFVSKNPGRSVDELAQELGVTREALLEELDLLTMVGRPPFQPDDFVDIYVENDRVYVELDQRLSAPPQLTPTEGVALAAAARLLNAGHSQTVQQAISKLVAVLPATSRQRFLELDKGLDVAVEGSTEVELLTLAITEGREVTFDYLTPSTGVRERRVVWPLSLKNVEGRWYVSAFDVARHAERLFRVDRMDHASTTGQPIPDGPHRTPKGPTPSQRRVRVRFAAQRAALIREQFSSDVQTLPDGRVEVWVPGDNLHWLSGWILSFGGDAVVVEPASARAAVVASARQRLAALETGS
jgi:proteasome accessory factor C